MKYQITMQSRDPAERSFVVEVEADTGDDAAAIAVAKYPATPPRTSSPRPTGSSVTISWLNSD